MKIPYETMSLREALCLLRHCNGYFDADEKAIIIEFEGVSK